MSPRGPRGGLRLVALTLVLSAVAALLLRSWNHRREVEQAYHRAPAQARADVLVSLLAHDPDGQLQTILRLAEADPAPRVRSVAQWVRSAAAETGRPAPRAAWLAIIPTDPADADPLDPEVRQRRALRSAITGSADPASQRTRAERAHPAELAQTLRLAAWMQDGERAYTPIARGLLDQPPFPRDVALLALLYREETAAPLLLDWFGPTSPLTPEEQAGLLQDAALLRVLQVALPGLPDRPTPEDTSAALKSYLGMETQQAGGGPTGGRPRPAKWLRRRANA